jgi:hypothetical protein
MESLKIIPKKYHRKTKSFIFKYCNLSFFRTKENLFKSNKIDYENISLKSKNTQSASTGPDDRKENILKKSSSEKIINLSSILNRLSKRKNVHSIELILKGRRKGSTPEKNANEVININKKDDRYRCKEIKVTKINKNDSNQKIINSGKNKNINPKINNNNIIGKTYKEDKSNFNGITQLSRNILKAIPPKLNYLFNDMHDLSVNNNNKIDIGERKKFHSNIPNVFINHLMMKNSIYNKNNSKHLLLSTTNRIKGKKLTIFYYLPKKNVL